MRIPITHVDGFGTVDGAIEPSAPDTTTLADGQANLADSQYGYAVPAVHGCDDLPEVATVGIDTDGTYGSSK